MVKQELVVGVFVHDNGKLLIGKRAMTKKFLPGKYEMPGGHIELGETYEQAAARELKEEMGIDIEVGMPYNAFSYTDQDNLHTTEINCFGKMKDPKQGIRLDPSEVSDYRWVTEQELPSYLDLDSDDEGKAAKKGFEVLRMMKQDRVF